MTKDYISCRNPLTQRFVDERLGRDCLQYDGTKLFKPIASAAAESQAAKSKELQKITIALEHLPAQIAAEANYNPIAALWMLKCGYGEGWKR